MQSSVHAGPSADDPLVLHEYTDTSVYVQSSIVNFDMTSVTRLDTL